MSWLTKLLRIEAPAPAEVHRIEDRNFEREVLRSELPVLLDAWGEGCAPCRMLEPVVRDLSRKYRGRLKVAEVNVANAPKLVARLGIRGTPTVLYFHGGKVQERIVGYRALHYHSEYLEQELFPLVAEG